MGNSKKTKKSIVNPSKKTSKVSDFPEKRAIKSEMAHN